MKFNKTSVLAQNNFAQAAPVGTLSVFAVMALLLEALLVGVFGDRKWLQVIYVSPVIKTWLNCSHFFSKVHPSMCSRGLELFIRAGKATWLVLASHGLPLSGQCKQNVPTKLDVIKF